MGCDGGTIPTRDELVKLKKKAKKVDKDVDLEARWMRCALTLATLKEPIVACALGRLYNKDSVLEYLLDKEKFADQASLVPHIKGMKDIVTLKLHRNPAFSSESATARGGSSDANACPFMCPITDLPMNGHYKFAYLKRCGCVFSEKALREIPADACHVCGVPFSSDDVITINPGREVEEEILEGLLAKQAKKKDKKKAKTEDAPTEGTGTKRAADAAANGVAKKQKEAVPRAPALETASAAYKSLFIDPKKAPSKETFTCRAVHRAYIH
eukprot:comp22295_c1_seq1/m.33065 comp22295_c1_seq1/g.33065  ORF comp22295_c1_seq1/g.33065 comp22295_c1_seq1/m.33065 type:complete len:270 (-) comp22295_c1_seq1:461-1270(-)